MDTLTLWYNWCGTDEGGLFLWGLYTRCLGLIYVISLFSLSRQIKGLAGSQGITPATPTMRAWYRDFGRKAYYWWPTVYWLTGTSDFALQYVPLLGVLCGIGTILGGPYSPYFLFGSWLSLISIDNGPVVLIYPWDSFLCEIGFLSIWLPSTRQSLLNYQDSLTVADVALSSLPSNLYAWSFRWIIFRLLFGFGKLKFMGTQWRDRLYIKNFLLTQPMISPFGMWAYHALSNGLWIFALFTMFVIEIIFPLTQLFYDGIYRILTAIGIILLMIGINVAGNFGYFNILTAVGCIPLLHHSSALSWTLEDIAPSATWTMLQQLFVAVTHDISSLTWRALPSLLTDPSVHVYEWSLWRPILVAIFIFLVQIPGGFIQFLMNSWVNLGWIFWPGIERASIVIRLPLPYLYRKYNETQQKYDRWLVSSGIDINLLAPLVWYTKFLRLIAPFRTVQAYGVFPPATSPPQRWACVIEGSNDGLVWERYEYMYYLSSPKTPPRFIAPHHPRFDHAIFYESLGLNGCNFLCNFGHYLPYSWFVSCTPWQRLQMGLLHGDQELFKFFRTNPFPDPRQPPKYVRGLICHYIPAPVDHVKKTEEYWIERKMGLHLPPLSLSTIEKDSQNIPYIISDSCPVGPEDFWWENIHWRVYAEKSTGIVTQKDYDEVWQFLDDVRRMAVEAAYEQSQKEPKNGKNNVPVAYEEKKERRRSSSRGGSRNTSSANAPSKQSSNGRTEDVRCIAHIVNEQYYRFPVTETERNIIAKAYATTPNPANNKDPKKKKSASAASSLSTMDTETASAVLQWIYTPDAVVKLRGKYSLVDLIRIRITLNRLILPIMRICYRLFQRVTPTKAQLQDELRSVDGLSSELQELYLQFSDYVEVPSTDHEILINQNTNNNTIPSTTIEGFPTYAFAGNIGAGRTGCLRSPLQWGMYGHYVCLLGGQTAYESLLGGSSYVQNHVLNTIIPTGITGIGKKDWIGTAPLPILFRQLFSTTNSPNSQDSPLISPFTMGTESGTFLLVLLCYDTWVDMSVGYHRLICQSRPSTTRVSKLPATIPAFLHLVTRLLAHPRMRIRHVPSIANDPKLNRNGRLRSKEMENDNPLIAFGTGLEDDSDRPLCVEAAVPLWKSTEDETDYNFYGTFKFGTRL